jgi:hypothetical protein
MSIIVGDYSHPGGFCVEFSWMQSKYAILTNYHSIEIPINKGVQCFADDVDIGKVLGLDALQVEVLKAIPDIS